MENEYEEIIKKINKIDLVELKKNINKKMSPATFYYKFLKSKNNFTKEELLSEYYEYKKNIYWSEVEKINIYFGKGFLNTAKHNLIIPIVSTFSIKAKNFLTLDETRRRKEIGGVNKLYRMKYFKQLEKISKKQFVSFEEFLTMVNSRYEAYINNNQKNKESTAGEVVNFEDLPNTSRIKQEFLKNQAKPKKTKRVSGEPVKYEELRKNSRIKYEIDNAKK